MLILNVYHIILSDNVRPYLGNTVGAQVFCVFLWGFLPFEKCFLYIF